MRGKYIIELLNVYFLALISSEMGEDQNKLIRSIYINIDFNLTPLEFDMQLYIHTTIYLASSLCCTFLG